MALTVILFSILLSTGIGAYLSGKLFHKNPYKAIMISIPPLVGIVSSLLCFPARDHRICNSLAIAREDCSGLCALVAYWFSYGISISIYY